MVTLFLAQSGSPQIDQRLTPCWQIVRTLQTEIAYQYARPELTLDGLSCYVSVVFSSASTRHAFVSEQRERHGDDWHMQPGRDAGGTQQLHEIVPTTPVSAR